MTTPYLTELDAEIERTINLPPQQTGEWLALLMRQRSGYLAGKAEADPVKEALIIAGKAALHDLETVEGLYATDGFDAYGDAQRNGCDPEGAWNCFVEQTFKLKHPSLFQLCTAIALAEKEKQ